MVVAVVAAVVLAAGASRRMGTINKRPVVVNDAIAIRPIIHLSLSYDHRVVDGADASRFLQVLKRELEKPLA